MEPSLTYMVIGVTISDTNGKSLFPTNVAILIGQIVSSTFNNISTSTMALTMATAFTTIRANMKSAIRRLSFAMTTRTITTIMLTIFAL